MSSFRPGDVQFLRTFKPEKILNRDPSMMAFLGSFSDANVERSVVLIENLPLPVETAEQLCTVLDRVELIQHTDIYAWMFAWLSGGAADAKITIICPATDVHIKKYTAQTYVMVQETHDMYESILRPYIQSLSPKRTQWVQDILSGKSEADKILYSDSSLDAGFVILPDMKWDTKTISNLYLQCIARNGSITNLRDLTKEHLTMLMNIRERSHEVVQGHFGLPKRSVRLYVHYQPSYYHFHVHIVYVGHTGLKGMVVGQAHLLDDIIELLRLSPDDGPTLLQRMTMTYPLGDQHDLFAALSAAQI